LHAMCNFVTAPNPLRSPGFLTISRFRRANRGRNGSKVHDLSAQAQPTGSAPTPIFPLRRHVGRSRELDQLVLVDQTRRRAMPV
jgi:hypothetical protein